MENGTAVNEGAEEVNADNVKRRLNPYRHGSQCYLAYEMGYMDAIYDVKKVMEETEEWRYDEAERRAGGRKA